MTSEYVKYDYPVTIFYARYGGAYEGGPWVAVNTEPGDGFPEDALGGDTECSMFFLDVWKGEYSNSMNERMFAGSGNNPQEALDDLIQKMK